MLTSLLLAAVLATAPDPGPSALPPAPGRVLLDAVVDGHTVRVWGWSGRYSDGSPFVGYYRAENPHLDTVAPPIAPVDPTPDTPLNFGVSLPDLPTPGESIRTNDKDFGEAIARDLERAFLHPKGQGNMLSPAASEPSPGQRRRLFGPRPQPCPGPGPCPNPEPAPDVDPLPPEPAPAPANHTPKIVAGVVVVGALFAAGVVLVLIVVATAASHRPSAPEPPHVND